MSYAMFSSSPQNFGGGGSFLGVTGEMADSSLSGFQNFNTMWQQYLKTKSMEDEMRRGFNAEGLQYPVLRSVAETELLKNQREQGRYGAGGVYPEQDRLLAYQTQGQIAPFTNGTIADQIRAAQVMAEQNALWAQELSGGRPAPFMPMQMPNYAPDRPLGGARSMFGG